MIKRNRTFYFLIPLFIIITSGCPPPVSEDLEINITGKVLDENGSPMSNQQVLLYKSNLPIFSIDSIMSGLIAASDEYTYRTTYTDQDGSFQFILTGKEANTPDQSSAAFFAVAAIKENTENQEAIASYDFNFSDYQPNADIGDMRFWNDKSFEEDQDTLNFNWGELPEEPQENFLLIIDGIWMDEMDPDKNYYKLPKMALPPWLDLDTVYRWEVVGFGKRLRYRTSFDEFSHILNDNPVAIVSKVEDLDGFELLNVTDQRIDRGADFSTSTENGKRGFVVQLDGNYAISGIVIYGAQLRSPKTSTVVVSVGDGNNFQTVSTRDMSNMQFPYYFNAITLSEPIVGSEIKLEVTGINSGLVSVREVIVYGEPVD